MTTVTIMPVLSRQVAQAVEPRPMASLEDILSPSQEGLQLLQTCLAEEVDVLPELAMTLRLGLEQVCYFARSTSYFQ